MIRLSTMATACVLVITSFVAPPVTAAANPAAFRSADPGPWRHPVDAPIIDYFRAPSGPFAAGNRGLEYDTEPGQEVVAVAAGTVTFAGSVGRNRFVVVAHGPTLRSTYAYLQSIEVSTGDAVVGGERVARAEPNFHLTARIGPSYVDPLRFIESTWSVRLVAGPRVHRLIG